MKTIKWLLTFFGTFVVTSLVYSSCLTSNVAAESFSEFLETEYSKVLTASIDKVIIPLWWNNDATFSLTNVDMAEQPDDIIITQPPGCDTIVFKSGSEYIGKIEEIGQTEIKYRRCDNLNGPVISILKSEVSVIKYSNGTREFLSSANTAAVSSYNLTQGENPISKFALALNPLGFVQFGPIVSAEFGLSDNLVLNAHIRFPSLGLLSYAVADDPDELDKLSGFGIGGGPLYFFGERKSKPYFGVLLEYGKMNLLYDKDESYEWKETDKVTVFMVNGGYRFRFANGIFINTGAYFGVANVNWVWDYTNPSYPKSGGDGKDINPFGMAEVSFGIEF